MITLGLKSTGAAGFARRAMRAAAISTLALAAAACTTAGGTGVAVSADAAVPAGNFDFVGWDGYLGGGDSSQYSALDQINRSNVNQLEVAWTYETGPGAPPIFSPTIGGGRMYVQNGAGKLVALDPATAAAISRRWCGAAPPMPGAIPPTGAMRWSPPPRWRWG